MTFRAETVTPRTNQTAWGNRINPPRESVQTSWLDRTRQTPVSPESQAAEGSTSCSHPLRYARAKTESRPSLVPVSLVPREKSRHSFGMMEFQAARQPVGQLLPGAALALPTRPIKVAQRSSTFLVKILRPGGKQEMIYSFSADVHKGTLLIFTRGLL